ncbi:MAG: LemA family protein [Planctomycetaceae bacterium]|nr:LemA family protein [Planctomycetaceae bacterium]
MDPIYWVLIGAVVLGVLWTIVTYNSLVRLRMGVKNSWADIDVQLQRRYDLIPNLVEIAKGYLKHERELLENVTRARSGCVNALANAKAGPTTELISAEGALGGALSKLMIQVEAYPDLKANTNMMQLTEEVSSTENKISFARQYYNDTVNALNTKVESFPANIIANMFSFKQANFFEVANREQLKEAPKIAF